MTPERVQALKDKAFKLACIIESLETSVADLQRNQAAGPPELAYIWPPVISATVQRLNDVRRELDSINELLRQE